METVPAARLASLLKGCVSAKPVVVLSAISQFIKHMRPRIMQLILNQRCQNLDARLWLPGYHFVQVEKAPAIHNTRDL